MGHIVGYHNLQCPTTYIPHTNYLVEVEGELSSKNIIFVKPTCGTASKKFFGESQRAPLSKKGKKVVGRYKCPTSGFLNRNVSRNVPHLGCFLTI